MDDPNWIYINKRLSIPLAELQFRFSTSSGPGGQHANRSATRVTLLYDVARSPNLDEPTRFRLMQALATRLDKRGVLQIDVQESRSQAQNRELAIHRFRSLLANALKRSRRRHKTGPSQASIEERLAKKKKRGQRKRDRGRQWPDG